jgi:DNA-binding PadR family transcriptional regulator
MTNAHGEGLPYPRMTLSTQAVLRILVVDPRTHRYGLEIGAEAGLPSGTIHPILARLERLGWVESGWEDVDPRDAGRPRRRYYHLTDGGLQAAKAALAHVAANRARLSARVRPVADTP